jgi:hypothetical protein
LLKAARLHAPPVDTRFPTAATAAATVTAAPTLSEPKPTGNTTFPTATAAPTTTAHRRRNSNRVLKVGTAAVIKTLYKHPTAVSWINRERETLGLKALRKPHE